MGIVNEDSLKYPLIFNSDRNIFMSGGGTHTWNSSYEWEFTDNIYLNWFPGRLRGSASYNVIPSTESPVTIPLGSVAYVTLDNETDAASLTVSVIDGPSLPQGDNIWAVAIHRDIGLSPNNPVRLANGNTIKINGSWTATAGAPVNGFASAYTGTVWTVNHNLGTVDVIVNIVEDGSPAKVVYPLTTEITNANTVTVRFNETVTGRAIVIKGNF